MKSELIGDTTFKKYGLNNVEIWSTDCVTNGGKVEGIQFSCCNISKTLLFSSLLRFTQNLRLTFTEKSESE